MNNPTPRDEPMGKCCYGGLRTKRDCKSCAGWAEVEASRSSPAAPAAEECCNKTLLVTTGGVGYCDGCPLAASPAAVPVQPSELMREGEAVIEALMAVSDYRLDRNREFFAASQWICKARGGAPVAEPMEILATPSGISDTALPAESGLPVLRYSGWLWTHVVKGGDYRMLGGAKLQTDKPLGDMAEVVVYQGADGKLWAREKHEYEARFSRTRPDVAVSGVDAKWLETAMDLASQWASFDADLVHAARTGNVSDAANAEFEGDKFREKLRTHLSTAITAGKDASNG